MSFLDAFFVDPACAYNVYNEDSEEKWVECTTSRSKSSLVVSCIIAAVMMLVCLIFLPLDKSLIVVAICAAALGIMFYGHYTAGHEARARFLNSRRELAAAGYDSTMPYSAQERVDKRAAAMAKIREDQLKMQQINAVSGVGAAIIGSLTGSRVVQRPSRPATSIFGI